MDEHVAPHRTDPKSILAGVRALEHSVKLGAAAVVDHGILIDESALLPFQELPGGPRSKRQAEGLEGEIRRFRIRHSPRVKESIRCEGRVLRLAGLPPAGGIVHVRRVASRDGTGDDATCVRGLCDRHLEARRHEQTDAIFVHPKLDAELVERLIMIELRARLAGEVQLSLAVGGSAVIGEVKRPHPIVPRVPVGKDAIEHGSFMSAFARSSPRAGDSKSDAEARNRNAVVTMTNRCRRGGGMTAPELGV